MKIVKIAKKFKKADPSFNSGEEVTLVDLAHDKQFMETAELMLRVFGTKRRSGGVGLGSVGSIESEDSSANQLTRVVVEGALGGLVRTECERSPEPPQGLVPTGLAHALSE